MEKYREKIYYEYFSYIFFCVSSFFLCFSIFKYKHSKHISFNKTPPNWNVYNDKLLILKNFDFIVLNINEKEDIITVNKNLEACKRLKTQYPTIEIIENENHYQIKINTLKHNDFNFKNIEKKKYNVEYFLYNDENSWHIKINGFLYTNNDYEFKNGIKIIEIANNTLILEDLNGDKENIIL